MIIVARRAFSLQRKESPSIFSLFTFIRVNTRARYFNGTIVKLVTDIDDDNVPSIFPTYLGLREETFSRIVLRLTLSEMRAGIATRATTAVEKSHNTNALQSGYSHDASTYEIAESTR